MDETREQMDLRHAREQFWFLIVAIVMVMFMATGLIVGLREPPKSECEIAVERYMEQTGWEPEGTVEQWCEKNMP